MEVLTPRFPAYRATKYFNNSYELHGWLCHFDGVGRPAGIVMEGGKFSIWVKGIERIEAPGVPNDEPPSGVCIGWVHEFAYFFARIRAYADREKAEQ